MNPGKRILLNSYYGVTSPWRWGMRALRKAWRSEPVQILYYHRVADTHPNPWTIESSRFADQVDWLSERFEIVSLSEAQRRIGSGCNARPTAVITFDDGYADNNHFALPLLLDRRLPFTYFVTSGNVESGQPFPHDVKRGTPLSPNTPDDIRALCEAGVDIGAHTRTHADLAKLTPEQLEFEISGSKCDLQQMTGRQVKFFAFPFGQPKHMSFAAFSVARRAGFAGVCSAYGGYNFPGNDPFHLERFHADPEFIRFKQWLSVDSLKQLRTPTFDLQMQDESTQSCVANLSSTPVAEKGS